MGVNYIQIFGERNSGTNYLKSLLADNILEDIEIGSKFGWKHGFTNRKLISQEDTSNILFLLITKQPYAWITSMRRKPHHAPQLYFKSLSDFIRSEWVCYKGREYQVRAKRLKENPVRQEEEMLQERNPKTRNRITNVIELRNLKNEFHLALRQNVENFFHIKYEELLKDAAQVVAQLADRYDFQVRSEFRDSSLYHGKSMNEQFARSDYYIKEEFMKEISKEDLEFINSQIDWNLEAKLGYHMI